MTTDFVPATTEDATMTAREEAIPLLAQIVYDQAHKIGAMTLTIHGVDPADFDAANGELNVSNGTVWKTERLTPKWPTIEVVYILGDKSVTS